MDDLPPADLPSPSFDLPSVDELKRAVESGQRITQEDVSMIAQTESRMTGTGPVREGPAGIILVHRPVVILEHAHTN